MFFFPLFTTFELSSLLGTQSNLPCVSWCPSSWPHCPAAPLLLQEAFGESRSHPHPAAERLWSRQTQERLRVRQGNRRKLFNCFMGINDSGSLYLFLHFWICLSCREFSSALEFLQLLNSCTEDSSSPRPPFSTPPNHTTTPGMNSMKRTTLPVRKHESHWMFAWGELKD